MTIDLPPHVYLGTYAKSGGAGLYPLLGGDGLRLGKPAAEIRNASFAAFDGPRRLGYFVDEQDAGLVRTCRLDEHGWAVIAEHPTGGAAPCYVALDAGRQRLAVANYGSGSVALYALDPQTGIPAGDPQVWQGSGSGPVADRQEGPHLHCAVFSGETLYAVDLGSDRIFAFDLRDGHGLSDPVVAFAAPPGSGPRHLVFHPHIPVAYLVSELAATVTVLERDGKNFLARARFPLTPEGFSGDNLGGHIALDAAGARLYVTARGHDSIAVFAIAADGGLTLRQRVATNGASPRSFAPLEDQAICLVAHEEGQSVSLLRIRADGLLDDVSATVAAPGSAFVFSADPG